MSMNNGIFQVFFSHKASILSFSGIYFTSYYDEKDKVKLLTTAATVAHYNKSRELDDLLEEMCCKDPHELHEKILSLKNTFIFQEENPIESFADSMDIGISLDDIPCGFTSAQAEEFLRKVGIAGETETFSKICDMIEHSGYLLNVRNDKSASFAQNNSVIEVLYPDTLRYHQQGWDICINRYVDSKLVSTDYVEVKTHTEHSIYAGQFKLSQSQMTMALKYKEHYHIASAVTYSRSTNVKAIDFFTDIPYLLGSEMLKLDNQYSILHLRKR